MESEKRVFTGLKEGKYQCFRVESRMRDELNFFSVIRLGANRDVETKNKVYAIVDEHTERRRSHETH